MEPETHLSREEDFAGYAVNTAGDVNGDGLDDLLIGAYGADPSGQFLAGESYVVFGRATGFPATFPLDSLFPAGGNGSEGFVLMGYSENDRSGYSVSNAGDVNGDDIGDLIMGAPELVLMTATTRPMLSSAERRDFQPYSS